MKTTAIIILNWNGKDFISECIKSIKSQVANNHIILVDNGSSDGSLEFIKIEYPELDFIINKKNLGFAAGVNQGILRAIKLNMDYVGLFNNDAVAKKDWLMNLINYLNKNPKYGIATCKLISKDYRLDSTGDFYTSWGLPYPRGRGSKEINSLDNTIEIFGASGGASLYRVSMFKEIGLFDEDFFAYYEDVDISFRAQLAGWKIKYVPEAIAYHQIGATSSKIKGFTTYQTIKNLPWLLIKNVPLRYLAGTVVRFSIVYISFIISAIARGEARFVFKGILVSLILLPKKILQRIIIQHNKRVSSKEIWNLVVKDLPPNAYKLRKLRKFMSFGTIK